MSEQTFVGSSHPDPGEPPRPSTAYLQATQPLRDGKRLRGELISDYIIPNRATRTPVKPFVQLPVAPEPPPLLQPPPALERQFVQPPPSPPVSEQRRYSIAQKVIMGMACLVFVVGLAVSAQTLQANHAAGAQVTALTKKVDSQANSSGNSSLPSTVKPSQQAISQYQVAPDMARYLVIPKLKVDARVLQVGVNSSGQLGSPDNVYDTAWYTGSAKPGQPGATLIDGHVSSWKTHGVFYGIKQLEAGDNIQIIRGDGTTVNYQVVKTQIYPSNDVNMAAALTPVTAGKPGLNLISCTGQVKPGTSEFNERVIVFAQQM